MSVPIFGEQFRDWSSRVQLRFESRVRVDGFKPGEVRGYDKCVHLVDPGCAAPGLVSGPPEVGGARPCGPLFRRSGCRDEQVAQPIQAFGDTSATMDRFIEEASPSQNSPDCTSSKWS